LKKVEEGDGSEAKGREAKRREAKGREAKGREAKGSDGKRREGKRSKGKRSEVKRREAKGREAKGRGAKGRKGKRRLKKVGARAMVSRKAASFSMIPRDPKEKSFLDHKRGALTELSMFASRDLGNIKCCCFTLQPITALDLFFLLSH